MCDIMKAPNCLGLFLFFFFHSGKINLCPQYDTAAVRQYHQKSRKKNTDIIQILVVSSSNKILIVLLL